MGNIGVRTEVTGPSPLGFGVSDGTEVKDGYYPF
jgi:hypothetical protein